MSENKSALKNKLKRRKFYSSCILYIIVHISSFLSPTFSIAQIIENKLSNVNITESPFNAAFVKNNNIKSVSISLCSKPDNEMINDKGLVKNYEFDTLGNISGFYYTQIRSVRKNEVPHKFNYDTVYTNFYYNSLHQLILKRTHEGDSYNSWYYEYDSAGNVNKQKNFRETSVGESQDFKMGVQTLISLESFSYIVLSDLQIKKKCMNDEDRVYKEAIINYDEKKRKKDENYEFTVSWVRIGNSFKYDDWGRLIEKTYSSNASSDLLENSIYEYDSNGNLLLEKKLRNNQKTNEITYLYDENTKFLKSQLNRDFINNAIGIAKYSYEFWK